MKTYDQEQLEKAKKEVDMWRRRELDNMIFTDSEEERWFTEMMMSKPSGVLDVDEFANFMLKGYRDTRERNR